MGSLYLGLISGTSADGVDACLASFDGGVCRIQAAATTAYPPPLRQRVLAIIEDPQVRLEELGAADVAIGRFFAQCALELIGRAGVRPAEVTAIGHHGQTVFHGPSGPEPFSLQLGDPNSVAAITGITTVADLRGMDMALGGQGAPMVPAFHEWLFASPSETRVVLNVGGIANVTVLDPGEPTLGFDTGPGNTLLDAWVGRHLDRDFDASGRWAAGGRVDRRLLDELLGEPYFASPPPKSTGRELFNASWLDRRLAGPRTVADRDVQTTLAELTAATVTGAIGRLPKTPDRILVCGGGVHNDDLLARLRRLSPCPVESTEAHGLAPDWVEAAAFAWLAAARLENRPGNVPSVTGARQPAVLGGIYCGQDIIQSR